MWTYILLVMRISVGSKNCVATTLRLLYVVPIWKMGDILLVEVVPSPKILDIGQNKGDELTSWSMCQTTEFTTSIRNIGQLGF